MATDLDDLDETEGGPQPAKGRELVIIDLGHATMGKRRWTSAGTPPGSAPEDPGRVGVELRQQEGWGGGWEHVVHQVPAAVAVGPVQPPAASGGRGWGIAQLGDRHGRPLRSHRAGDQGGCRSTMVTVRPRTRCSTETLSRT